MSPKQEPDLTGDEDQSELWLAGRNDAAGGGVAPDKSLMLDVETLVAEINHVLCAQLKLATPRSHSSTRLMAPWRPEVSKRSMRSPCADSDARAFARPQDTLSTMGLWSSLATMYAASSSTSTMGVKPPAHADGECRRWPWMPGSRHSYTALISLSLARERRSRTSSLLSVALSRSSRLYLSAHALSRSLDSLLLHVPVHSGGMDGATLGRRGDSRW